mmetsp:Transcript_35717/g.76287  ORF Transcript_35717/g.76287 Transcript_35717/m.76287 type:complete len:129 (-) Transcript_35717:161-547(-)
MVDTRVVRRSSFNPMANNSKTCLESGTVLQQPNCILFDSRLIKGDVFTNPIVTVTRGLECDDDERTEKKRTDEIPRVVKLFQLHHQERSPTLFRCKQMKLKRPTRGSANVLSRSRLVCKLTCSVFVTR